MRIIIFVIKYDDRDSCTKWTRVKLWARRCLYIKQRKLYFFKNNEITRNICRQILNDSSLAYEDELTQQRLFELIENTERQMRERYSQGIESIKDEVERDCLERSAHDDNDVESGL